MIGDEWTGNENKMKLNIQGRRASNNKGRLKKIMEGSAHPGSLGSGH